MNKLNNSLDTLGNAKLACGMRHVINTKASYVSMYVAQEKNKGNNRYTYIYINKLYIHISNVLQIPPIEDDTIFISH